MLRERITSVETNGSERRRSRFGALIAGIALLTAMPLTSCHSIKKTIGLADFDVIVRTGELQEVASLFVIIGRHEQFKPLNDNNEAALVAQKQQSDYYYYAQFRPAPESDECWTQSNVRGSVRGDVTFAPYKQKKDFVLKMVLDAGLMEKHSEAYLVLLVQFADRSWQSQEIDSVDLKNGGSAEFSIGAKRLEPIVK